MAYLWILVLVVALGLPAVARAQPSAPPVPPDYQKLLEKALTREGSMLNMCVQQREDLIAYFQEELRKERKKSHDHEPTPAGPPPAAGASGK